MLPNAAALLECIKKAALDAVKQEKPVEDVFGLVISENPLQIRLDQKRVIEGDQLILTSAVRDHYVDMTVEHWTEDETAHTHVIHDTYTGGGASRPTTHKHEYVGRKKFLVHLGLKEGERVLLQRVQGGQRYIVWDRVV